MVPIGCPETSVRNYRYSLRNNSEERSSDQYWFRERSMFVVKSYKIHKFSACTKCTFSILKQLVLTVAMRVGGRTMAETLSQIILHYVLNTGMPGSKNSFERLAWPSKVALHTLSERKFALYREVWSYVGVCWRILQTVDSVPMARRFGISHKITTVHSSCLYR